MLTVGCKLDIMKHLLFSYLDPGTGSMVVQSIIGAVAGVAYLGRNAISRFVASLRKKQPADE